MTQKKKSQKQKTSVSRVVRTVPNEPSARSEVRQPLKIKIPIKYLLFGGCIFLIILCFFLLGISNNNNNLPDYMTTQEIPKKLTIPDASQPEQPQEISIVDNLSRLMGESKLLITMILALPFVAVFLSILNVFLGRRGVFS